MKYDKLVNELKSLEDKNQAKNLQRFLKLVLVNMEKGIFFRNKSSNSASNCKKYFNISLKDTEKLLHSKIHGID